MVKETREKACKTCGEVKLLHEFITDARTTLGYGLKCLECAKIKLCRTCRTKKPLDQFFANSRSADKKGYKCKDCVNDYRRVKYSTNNDYRSKRLYQNSVYRFKKGTREGTRERMLLREYNLTLEDYECMEAEQGGLCKICSHPPELRGRARLVVDHDHSTGKVRGLLCDSCNGALGMFLESEEVLNSALEYLRSNMMAAHFG